MTPARWTAIAEAAIVLILLAAALSVTLFTASVVRGQSVPGAPPAPGAPASPARPPVPASPPDPTQAATTQDLSLALAFLDASALGKTLTSVSGRRIVRSDADRLATVLAGTLGSRRLTVPVRDRLAAGLALALTTSSPGPALDHALAQVQAALVAAGLGQTDLVLVDRELRRMSGGRR